MCVLIPDHARKKVGIWDQLHLLLLAMLNREKELHLETAVVDTTHVRAFGGGEATGPSPVDRRKKGTKYTLLVDRDGIPLAIRRMLSERLWRRASQWNRVGRHSPVRSARPALRLPTNTK